jgi:hypothetical protein
MMSKSLLAAVSGFAVLFVSPLAIGQTSLGSGGAGTQQERMQVADVSGYVSYKENKKALTAKLPGGLTAEKLIGADIVSPAGDDVGEVGDLLVDKNGKANNVVVDVGGFLGIGGKNVVLDLNALTPAKGSDGDYVTNMTKEQLKALPAYEKKSGTWVLKTATPR